MSNVLSIGFVVQRYGGGSVGGAERFTSDLARGLASEGHRVEVLTSCATSYEDWADVLPPGVEDVEGVSVHRLPVRSPRDNRRFMPLHARMIDQGMPPMWPWAARRWASMMGPDLAGGSSAVTALSQRVDLTVFVGYHYAHSLKLIRCAASRGPTVLIPTAHPEGAFHTSPVREMFSFADRVICLADAEADLVDSLYRCGDRTDVVGCPVAPIDAPSVEVVEEARTRHGVRPGPYFVTVGRVDPAKGSDEAVSHASLVRSVLRPDLQLVVVGPGDLSACGEGIVSTGFVSEADKVALIAGSTALVQPSYMESFSLALMEGWLLQKPALVQARNGVLAGHVRNSGGGVLYDDYLSFEAGAVALVESQDLREGLALAGRDYVLREFAWTRVADEFRESFDRALLAGRMRLAG